MSLTEVLPEVSPVRGSSPVVESKRVVASWAAFDFANSAFSGIIITFVFPIFFGEVIVTNGRGDFYWGIAMSLSMLLVALVAPVLGAISDFSGNKKQFLFGFTAMSIACTAAMAFLQPGWIIVGSLLFIIGNAGFEGGLIFYDAFLPEITTPDRFGRVSGYGFALGYVGSLAALLLSIPFLPDNPRATFLLTAVLFAVFSIPMFRNVPSPRTSRPAPDGGYIRYGFKKTMTTISHIKRHKHVARFLLAFFLYNDAILTVIGFSGRYAKNTLGFTMIDLVGFFAMIQIVASLGSLAFGKLTDKHGPRLTIIITLGIWLAIIIASYILTTVTGFYIVGACAGIALGSSQSASRSYMALLSPPEYAAEFFGFYEGFCGKASAIIGPIAFGVLSDLFGQRLAVLSLGVFFMAGWLLIRTVKDVRPEPVPAV